MKIRFLLLTVCSGMFAFANAQGRFLQAVDEYVPAPGQFVNTMPVATAEDTPATMAAKCTQAIAGDISDQNHSIITLGAWGGYVTFHFDHPVVNVKGQRDFAVWGNAFENNAEPAIVFVSVDTNHNGLPDDEWYELRGSEYNNPKTIHNYELTYAYDAFQDVQWTDNQGQSGVVARNKFHKQEYFPLWLTTNGTLTHKGCRLPDNAYLDSYADGTQVYFLPAYEYGYADNQPNSNVEGCSMDISWAVDAYGNAVELDHVDFIRCQNAMNQTCGSIGETSTEIAGAEDLHPEAATGITETSWKGDLSVTTVYNLRGERMTQLQRGLNIIRTVDGKTRKMISK